MQTVICLVRHGETDWSRDQRFNGRQDIPLNDIGRQQCSELAAYLSDETIDIVISSPLSRCIETAEILAQPRGLGIVAEPRLVEMDYGQWEGLTYDQARQLDTVRFELWDRDPAAIAPPDGESGYTIATRVTAALFDILARHTGRTILLVAHKTVNRVLLCHALDWPIREYRRKVSQAPCALNRLEYKAGRIAVTVMNHLIELRQGSWHA
jgi:probable phosphoglycerate mutase